MELFAFFAFVIAVFFIFSGPIALIWCSVLSSRLNEMRQERERLEFLLKKQQEKERQAAQIRTPAARSEKLPEKTESPSPPQNVLLAMQAAKKQAAEEFRSEEVPEFKPAPPPLEVKEPEIKSAPDIPVEPVLSIEPEPVVLSPDSHVFDVAAKSSAPHRPLDDAEWEKAHPAAPARRGDIAWQSVELWIGRKLLGWVAVAAFVVSAALFIIHAVNEGWIGRIPPQFRVLGIAGFGGAFLVAGKYFHRIGWRRFSTMLSSAGVIIVFQAGYASFAYFELISIQTASVVMSLVVLGSFLLSWHYGSTLLGLISIIGGLAVPLLLSSGTDRYPEFFTYLVILNLGTVMLVNLLRRPPIGILAFVGTQAEFWLWYTQYYVEPVAPEKLGGVLLFQGAFYAVWLLDTTIAAMVPKRLLDLGASLTNFLAADPHEKGDVTDGVAKIPPKQKAVLPSWDDAVRAVLSPIVLFGTAWWLLRDDPGFGPRRVQVSH